MRRASQSEDPSEEAFAASRLLILEIGLLSPVDQFCRIIEADLKDIYSDFSAVLPFLTSEQVDQLTTRHGSGSAKQMSDLVLMLSMIDPPLSESSWKWFQDRAGETEFPHRGVVFKILYHADASRFGRVLLANGWQWGPDQDIWCNHFGSLALIIASTGLPFDQHASLIAPWLILRAVSLRGGSAADAEVAAAILNAILGAPEKEVPDLGSDISVSQEARESDPFSLSITVRPEHPNDPVAQFRDAFDTDKRTEVRRRAVRTAVERIERARAEGASLYLHNLSPEDFLPIIDDVPSTIAVWTEGFDGPTVDFRRRVRLAEGVYLALCEALLTRSPDQGAHLWRALRRSLITRFVGKAQVDQLTHMIFRVATAPETLRREQLDIANTNSDQELLDLAIAATVNEHDAWLDRVISEDEASGVVWRRQRAGKLRGFRTGNLLPTADTWPAGHAESLRISRQRETVATVHKEACARHWWQQYWQAETNGEAYAAWELFLRTADRRAFAWMRLPPDGFDATDARVARRVAHVELNLGELQSAMKKQEKKLDEQFLGRKIVAGVGLGVRPDRATDLTLTRNRRLGAQAPIAIQPPLACLQVSRPTA